MHRGPKLGAFVDLVEFADDETNNSTALFKTVKAFSGAFVLLNQRGAENKGRSWSWP